MPAPSSYLPNTATLSGYIWPLASELSQQLAKYRIPCTTADLSVINKTVEFSHAKYIFYFLPHQPLSTGDYLRDKKILKDLLTNPSITVQKICIVTIHPHDYFYDSLSARVTAQALLNHNLTQLEVVQQTPSANTRIIAIKHLIAQNSTGESPTLFSQIFNHPKSFLRSVNPQTTPITPISQNQAVKQIIKTTLSQHSGQQRFSLTGAVSEIAANLLFMLSRQLNLPISQAEGVIQLNNSDFPTTPIKTNPETINWINHFRPSAHQLKPALQPQTPTPPIPASPTPPKQITTTSQKIISKPSQAAQKAVSKPPHAKTPKSSPKPSRHLLKWGVVIFSLTSLILFLSGPLVYAHQIANSIKHFENKDLAGAIKAANIAQKIRPFINPAIVVYQPVIRSKIGQLTTQEIELFLEVSDQVSQLTNTADQLNTSANQLVSGIISSNDTEILAHIIDLKTNLQTTYQHLSQIQAKLDSLDHQKLHANIRIQFMEALQSIKQGRAYIETGLELLSVADQIIGLKEPKTYLVLLQNNHELRPTGGFIGSFALISFDQGKLIDIETHDVYSADGQLRGYVEPPEPIRQYLGEANWYLRDSNWEPNFPTTARRAEWFLSKEMNRQVDGTVAVDLYFVKDLLSVVGDIELIDYAETITSDNLFQRAQHHSEINFFPGSTQKKDFLSALINALSLKLTDLSGERGIDLASAIIQNAQGNHVQFSHRNLQVENSLENTPFSGSIKLEPCLHEDPARCISDYIGVVESNLGVNKTNYYVKRQVDIDVTLNPTNAQTTTTLVLQNTAASAVWPAGSYKNYLRFLIPEYASLRQLSIDGSPVPTQDIAIENKHGMKYVGVYVEIPLAGQKTIQLKSEIKTQSPIRPGDKYSLFLRKQPGTGEDALTIQVQNNSGIESTALLNNNTVSTNQPLRGIYNQNQQFSLIF